MKAEIELRLQRTTKNIIKIKRMNLILEPTGQAIASEMQRTGLPFCTCKEKLVKALQAEFDRLRELSPSGLSELTQLQAEAEDKLQKVNTLYATRRAKLEALEQQLFQLGKTRWLIAELRDLATTPGENSNIAQKTLDAFSSNLMSPSPQNSSAQFQGLTELAFSVAITPFIEPYVSKLETKCTQLVEQIRTTCKSEKLNLQRLLDTMHAEAISTTDLNVAKNPALVGYFERGCFADLLK